MHDGPRSLCWALAWPLLLSHLRARLQDVTLGDPRFRHLDRVTYLEALPEGELLSCSRDGTTRIWDLETGQTRLLLDHGGRDVWNARPLPARQEILTSDSRRMVLWNSRTGEKLREWTTENDCLQFDLTRDGKGFVVGDADGFLRAYRWDQDQPYYQEKLNGKADWIYTTLALPQRPKVLAGNKEGELFLVDLEKPSQIQTLLKELGSIPSMRISPGRDFLVVCSTEDQAVRCLDARLLMESWSRTLPRAPTVASWSPDGTRLAVSCDDSQIYLLDAITGQILKTFPHPGEAHWPTAWSPDGKRIYSGGDTCIFTWEVATGRRLFPEAPPHLEKVKGLVPLSPTQLLTHGQLGNLVLWSLADQAPLAQLALEEEIRAHHYDPSERSLRLVDRRDLVRQVQIHEQSLREKEGTPLKGHFFAFA
ncbi:MAG: hypothetical protein AAF555_00965 [Verrucomicrobiota bacterium]